MLQNQKIQKEFLYKKEIARQNLKCKVTLACKVWCWVSWRLGQNPNFLKCVLGLDPLVGIVIVMSICVILLVILLVACRGNQWPVRHIFTSIVWPTRRQSHIYTMSVWKPWSWEVTWQSSKHSLLKNCFELELKNQNCCSTHEMICDQMSNLKVVHFVWHRYSYKMCYFQIDFCYMTQV